MCWGLLEEIGAGRSMEEVAPNSCTRPGLEKKAKPQEQLNCPRCNSTNTKFCYYNNYSLTQPRYFCKTCRRYWTEGGSLRNVPVGGGSRKNKKISSYVSAKVPDLNPSSASDAISPQNPKMQGLHDLNLSFPMDKYHGMSSYVEMPKLEIGDSTSSHHHNSSSSSAPSSLSAVELLRSSMASRGLNPNYVPNSMMLSSSDPLYQPAGYPMQEIKPNLSFSVDGFGNRSYENGAGRLLFPFGDIKHLSTGVEVDNNKEQANNSTGYWTGIIGEGSSW